VYLAVNAKKGYVGP